MYSAYKSLDRGPERDCQICPSALERRVKRVRHARGHLRGRRHAGLGPSRKAFADPDSSVGRPEEQIASFHLQVPGWSSSLAKFAKSGGFANCGNPLPKQPFHVIAGKEDKIITKKQRLQIKDLVSPNFEELNQCGHLPHLDCPEIVANRWLTRGNIN